MAAKKAAKRPRIFPLKNRRNEMPKFSIFCTKDVKQHSCQRQFTLKPIGFLQICFLKACLKTSCVSRHDGQRDNNFEQIIWRLSTNQASFLPDRSSSEIAPVGRMPAKFSGRHRIVEDPGCRPD